MARVPGCMMMGSDPARRAAAILDIDLGAIVANWRLLARLATPAQCAAVVKANGYGLGAAPVSRALAAGGCRMFVVATLDEGIGLRQALGADPEIIVLNGPPPGTDAEFAEHGLVPVLNHPGQIAEWENATEALCRLDPHPKPPPLAGEGISGGTSSGYANPPPQAGEGRVGVVSARSVRGEAILHVDTGMSRLGLTAHEFAALMERPSAVRWRAVMSHLACADEPEHPLNATQRERFAAVAAHFPGISASLAASCGIFLGPQYHFDIVRPGAALYGVNPQPGRPNKLRQVVRLSAKILQIRQIDRGETVGYGAAHMMQGAGRVATVGVGYADGWLRSLSRRGCGSIAGTRVPLIGRVSMDLATFDVSAVPEDVARPGATVELLGADYGVDDAAADAGTIGYEILTALGARYHRVYHAAGEDHAA